jgi:hypothetical protein
VLLRAEVRVPEVLAAAAELVTTLAERHQVLRVVVLLPPGSRRDGPRSSSRPSGWSCRSAPCNPAEVTKRGGGAALAPLAVVDELVMLQLSPGGGAAAPRALAVAAELVTTRADRHQLLRAVVLLPPGGNDPQKTRFPDRGERAEARTCHHA